MINLPNGGAQLQRVISGVGVVIGVSQIVSEFLRALHILAKPDRCETVGLADYIGLVTELGE
jgi:hypothetical protein